MLDDLKSFGDFLAKFALFLGVTATLAYMFFSIHYVPAGLTLGDSIFFFAVALAFGLAYAVLVLIGWLLVRLLASAWRGGCMGRCLVTGILVFLALGVFAVFVWLSELILLATAFCAFTMAGFFLHLLIDWVESGRRRQTAFIYAMLIGIAVFPILAAPAVVRELNQSYVMENLGLRDENVTLKLSEENYNMLVSAVGGRHLPVLGCSTVSGAADRLVHGVTLLWHGIGERTLVGVPIDATNRVEVELKREGVAFVRKYGPSERCFELSGDVIFLQGSDQLADRNERAQPPETGTDLDDMMKVIAENFDIIQEVRIVGHADPLGYPGGAAKNNQLAKDRAKAIASLVEAYIKLQLTKSNVKADVPDNFILSEGHGAREPKTLCKDWPVKATLSECLAVNRRVEIKMKFKKNAEAQPAPALPPEQTKA